MSQKMRQTARQEQAGCLQKRSAEFPTEVSESPFVVDVAKCLQHCVFPGGHPSKY